MIFLLSPAKTLDYDSDYPELPLTQPSQLEQSSQLIKVLLKLSQDELGELMSLSDKLAQLNVERYQEWQLDHSPSEHCKPALLAFKGDVYQGLAANQWKKSDFTYAQKHLRILSGLYGILRPLDLMRPYRLEMGTKLPTTKGKNLYEFWDSAITDELNAALKKGDKVINLASNEYFSAVQKKHLQSEVITPVFKDFKNGKFKIISFYAKKARGSMAAWAIKNRISKAEELCHFDQDGYYYDADSSDDKTIVFLRNPEQAN